MLLWMRDPEIASASRLGFVKGEVRSPDELFGRGTVVRRNCHADAHADVQPPLADHELTCQGLDQPCCQHLGVPDGLNACLHDDEFVAADTGGGVGRSCFLA